MLKPRFFGGAIFALFIVLLAAALLASPVFDVGSVETVEIVELAPVDQVPDQAIESVDFFGFAILVKNITLIPRHKNRAQLTVDINGPVAVAVKNLMKNKRGLDENKFIYLA
jgi:hypothetical protein